MKITITLPDEVAERVRSLPDQDEFVARAVEAALVRESHSQLSAKSRTSRWAQLIERIEKQPSSLGSYTKDLDRDRREFRQSLRFPHDER
jgi:hypothetical protein